MACRYMQDITHVHPDHHKRKEPVTIQDYVMYSHHTKVIQIH